VHFGVSSDVARHLGELRERLRTWTEWMSEGMTEEEFGDAVRSGLLAEGRSDVDVYERAMPFWQSYAGLKRYWDKRGEGT
jgi:hypothetical protein